MPACREAAYSSTIKGLRKLPWPDRLFAVAESDGLFGFRWLEKLATAPQGSWGASHGLPAWVAGTDV